MSLSSQDSLSIAEFASLFGFESAHVIAAVEAQRQRRSGRQPYFSIRQLADRWVCSVPQVYKILQTSAAKIVNVGEGSKRKKVLVPADVVERLERARVEKMS
jgi:hypothetical protein